MLIDALVFLQEAARVLHLDKSHDALRSKLQTRLRADHLAANPDGSYYDSPYVQDVYGSDDSGSVVYSKNGQHTMAKFKAKGDTHEFSDHKPVKRAYVTADTAHKEGLSGNPVFVDGLIIDTTLAAKESLQEDIHEEKLDLREAAFDSNGNGLIKLIAPGHGSTGYYSAEVLKEAVKKGVFDNAQMFIDHATDEEEAARPEGSVKGLAAKGGKATYEESGAEGAGVYTKASAYPDTRDFLNARAKDIGVSIRALGRGVAGQVGGRVNKIVKSLDVLKSADFVTRAGAGGKLVPLLESFRTKTAATAAKKGNTMADVTITDTELAALKESAAKIPTLQLQIDRGNERFARLDARDIASAKLSESGLPAPAQKRVLVFLTGASSVLPLKEGALDMPAFEASIKAAVEAEAAYLKEAGVQTAGVRLPGNQAQETTADETKLKESLAKFDEEMSAGVSSLSGVPRKEKK